MTATPATAPPAARAGRYLTFRLGAATYGIPILNVREIIRLCPITPVPRMPEYIKGVINLRGTVVPVVDLRAKFQMPVVDYGERTCIIVMTLQIGNGPGTLMGAVVDAVEEVVTLNTAEIEPTPDFGGTTDTQYIIGIATQRGGVKTLLDVEKIFIEEGSLALPETAAFPSSTQKESA